MANIVHHYSTPLFWIPLIEVYSIYSFLVEHKSVVFSFDDQRKQLAFLCKLHEPDIFNHWFWGIFFGGEGGEAIQKDCYNEGGNITAFNKNPIKMKILLYYIHCGYTVADL